MLSNYQMIIMFVVYIIIMLLIGFLAYRSTSNFADYILGGRKLGGIVTALSAGASDMSGWLLMGLPGIIFVTGISESWIAIGLSLGAYLNWKLVAGRLRIQTENNNSLTLPDYFSNRFEDKTKILRIISALVILIFFTIYCSSGIVASGLLFENTFGINYKNAMWLGALAAIIYTFLGGFLAVSWTDTVQATLMIFALLLTPIMVIFSVDGLENAIKVIYNKDPIYLDIFKNFNFITMISLLGWGLGYFGQPHILSRFMAADSAKTINQARRISMIWMILCLMGTISVGFFAIAYFDINPHAAVAVIAKPERVFIELAGILFNPWLSGIVLSAILAAVMSTLSCQLLVCTSVLTEDFYKVLIRKKKTTQMELVWVGRLMVLFISAIAMFIAQDPNNKVLVLVSNAWAGFGAAFGPVVLISVLWKRMNFYGALSGMIVGAVTVLIWMQYKWFGLYEIIPGFIFSSISIFIISWLTPKPSSIANNLFMKSEKEYHITNL